MVKFIIDFNDKVPSVFIILISSLSSINSIAGGVLHLYIKFTASVVSSNFCSISFISVYGFNSYASFFDASKWQYEANFSNILLYSNFCKYYIFASFPKTFFISFFQSHLINFTKINKPINFLNLLLFLCFLLILFFHI